MQLRADTDAEKRPPPLADRLVHRLDHARDAVEAATAIGESADAGKHHMVGGEHVLGARGDFDLLFAPASRAARSNAFRAECRLPEP